MRGIGEIGPSSSAFAWSNSTEGTYNPTPIVYLDRLIARNVNDVVTMYGARTGQRAVEAPRAPTRSRKIGELRGRSEYGATHH